MLYKPNYCCNCGDKIERIEWNPLTSRRFCQVCETENPLDKLLKIIFPTVLFLFGVFGISGYFQTPDTSIEVTKSDKKAALPNKENGKAANIKKLKSKEQMVFDTGHAENRNLENEPKIKQPNTIADQNAATVGEQTKEALIAESPQKIAKESVYYCGAETKKGTPCSRKVKGGGRCWQHEGREAILSAKELKIEN